jgi:alpha-1,3-rhamnosyl/mannosyltransferase
MSEEEFRHHPALKPLRPVVRVGRKIVGALRRRLRRLSPRAFVRTGRWVGGIVGAVRRRRGEGRLTVAVDGNALWEPLTGIGWYVFKLLEEWAADGRMAVRVYGATLFRGEGTPEPSVEVPEGPGVEWVRYELPDDLVLAPPTLARLGRGLSPLLLAADGNRVLFAPNYFLPRSFVLARAPLVATVHDLSVRRVPWSMREETRRDLAERLDHVLYEARRVLTDSAAVGRELVDLAGTDPAKVRVVPLGPGQAWSEGEQRDAVPPAGTPPRYGLFVGTLEPRKNLLGLLDAWRRLRRDLPGAPPLVLVGGFGWRSETYRHEVEAAEEEGWLLRFGYVSHGELLALYRGAAVVVLPSFYEGFGLPALEAMGTGTPLVLADIPVLREVGGDAALYAPPARPDLIAARLAAVLGDRDLAAGLAEHGRRRAAGFTWARAARDTAAVLAEAGPIG